jgi:hypothetical protein
MPCCVPLILNLLSWPVVYYTANNTIYYIAIQTDRNLCALHGFITLLMKQNRGYNIVRLSLTTKSCPNTYQSSSGGFWHWLVSCDTSYLSFFHQDPSGNEAEMAMIAFGFVAFFCTLWWQRGPWQDLRTFPAMEIQGRKRTLLFACEQTKLRELLPMAACHD